MSVGRKYKNWFVISTYYVNRIKNQGKNVFRCDTIYEYKLLDSGNILHQIM